MPDDRNDNNSQTPRDPKIPGMPGGKKPTRTGWLYFILACALLGYAFFNMGSGFASSSNTVKLATSEMVSAIKQDRVEDLTYTVQDGSVTGHYWKTKKDKGDTSELKSFSSTYVGSDSLAELMAEHPDTKYIVNTNDPDFWGDLAMSVLPTIALIAIMFYFMRQMMGANNRNMQFGKTNAKTNEATRPKVKFEDVAGVDEAVEELEEIRDFLSDPDRYRKLGAKIPRGVLLVGPPGTGKTSCALKKMVETFYKEEGAQILLLSYTNRAVDEICKALSSIRPEVDFIRVGSELSCDENYRDHLIENELATCMRRTEVCERINRCRILVGTVASISGKPELFRLKHFDVAIVDEATQILEPQLLGILCAKGENGKEGVGKFILIGDHKQLPAVVLQNTEQSEVYDEALSAVGLKNLKDSLFERLYRTARQHTDAHRTYDMLCRQGRMHPEVALFANQAFYEGRLLPVGLPHQLEDSGNINRLSFYPSRPEPMGSSAKTNHSEAKIAARLAATVYKEHSEAFDASRTLGIITPYRSQIALIKKEIEVLGISELNQILIDTVERFQGSERDVIIYSFCVNYPYQLKFLSNLTEEDGILIDRKLNVALTRARKQMLLTGVPTLLERNPLYKSLLKLIESLRNIA